jgi:hypothetical protein
MLTECDKPVWFVLELCETIKLLRFETDNYELYSGGPKLLSVSVADKYSSHRRDWLHIGNFTVSGHKKMAEAFGNFSAEVFARFVWVDVLANYDEEHYCTMTSFRVFGISEYEYLLEDSSSSSSISSSSSSSSSTELQPDSFQADSSIQGKLREVSLFQKKEKKTKVKFIYQKQSKCCMYLRHDYLLWIVS